MNEFYRIFADALGLGAEPGGLTTLQVALRAVVVFLLTLIMVRFGSKRALAEKTAFDTVLIVILGSVISRAINGSAPFLASLAGGVTIVVLHRLMAVVAFHSHAFGNLVKGREHVLVRDGKHNASEMAWNHVSEHDLREDLRLRTNQDNLSAIAMARLERNGDISFVLKK